jgi:hypothetical protein
MASGVGESRGFHWSGRGKKRRVGLGGRIRLQRKGVQGS